MKMTRNFRFVTILAALSLSAVLSAQQVVEQPKVYYSDSSRKGIPFAKDPSVIKFQGRYLMYYSLPPSVIKHEGKGLLDETGWSIGIAESRDLVHWTKAGEVNPVQPIESKGIAAPGARVIRGQVHLFFQTYGGGSKDAICHATSTDGIHFVHDPSNPVYRPKPSSWSVGRAIDAEVILLPQKNKALLYYATRDPQMRKQMLGVAEASLDSDFSAGAWHDVNSGGPLLEPTEPWEQLCIEAPTVVQHGKVLYMFYAGAYNNQPQQIGVASSTDGVHWKRLSAHPFLPNGASGSWNTSESGHPGVLQDGDKTYLFYQGNNDHGKTYHLSMIPILWQGETPLPDFNWDKPMKAGY
jgi:predicted GH43/DUF377 family glycosyl hydrolase